MQGLLVVLGVVPEGVQELLGLQLAGADEVDGGEEGELVLQALGGQVSDRSWVVALRFRVTRRGEHSEVMFRVNGRSEQSKFMFKND